MRKCRYPISTTTLYIYPELDTPIAVFDDDELSEEALLVLCVRSKGGKSNAFVWIGEMFEEGEMSKQEFVKSAIKDHFSDQETPTVTELEEGNEQSCPEFLEYIYNQHGSEDDN